MSIESQLSPVPWQEQRLKLLEGAVIPKKSPEAESMWIREGKGRWRLVDTKGLKILREKEQREREHIELNRLLAIEDEIEQEHVRAEQHYLENAYVRTVRQINKTAEEQRSSRQKKFITFLIASAVTAAVSAALT